MSERGAKHELLVLTADKNTQFALEGLLSRPRDLGIRSIGSKRILVHPRRDPAVFRESHSYLRPFLNQAERCLVVFDREGCGAEDRSREELERIVQSNLEANGWRDRAGVVAIDPELEIWVWADSEEVDRVLGWPVKGRKLRTWLTGGQFSPSVGGKPARPKEAMEAALCESRTARSSALYKELAEQVSFQRCTDPAFQKLLSYLRNWFPS